MKKIVPVKIDETRVYNNIEITAYLAGHILVTAAFYFRVANQIEFGIIKEDLSNSENNSINSTSNNNTIHKNCGVLYTGNFDISYTSDNHLSGAVLPLTGLRPWVVILESTYCNTIRGCKIGRES
jgi:Cft2 family RNA processing exonuclease